MSIRLNKLLANRGIASRRHCDVLIAEGRVRVNGRTVNEAGTPVVRTVPREGTGSLAAMVAADGLVVLPEAATGLAAGTLVDFVPVSEMTR